MVNSLQFNISGNNYEVSLVLANQDVSNSVLIGGVKYTIGGQKDAVELFKQKIQELDLTSMYIKDLQKHLSVPEHPHTIPHMVKVQDVGVGILNSKKIDTAKDLLKSNDVDGIEERKSKVLNEVVSTWPIPSISSPTIADRIDELGIKGARIAVINGGEKKEWSEGFGELKQPTMMAQAASISKTITALTIMSLIKDKVKVPKTGEELTLYTNIRDILSNELWDSISDKTDNPITIQQLMSHTAGLEEDTFRGYRGYFQDKQVEIGEINGQISELEHEREELLKQSGGNEKRIKHIEQQIESLKKAQERISQGSLPSLDEILKGEATNSPPVRRTMEPGKQHAYSGGGAIILQKIIETIQPYKTYEAVVKERVFQKLGMDDSTFSPSESSIVDGYGEDSQRLPGGWVRQPELAAAGLWSTPEDLTKVAIEIQKALKDEGKILDSDQVREMITRPEGIKVEEGKIPGLGVFVDETSEATYFYHSGSNLGFRCLMVANDKGQGAVIMTNSELGNELIPEVIRRVADVYGWKGKDSLKLGFPPLHPEVVEKKDFDSQKWIKNYGNRIFKSNKGGEVRIIVKNDHEVYFRPPGKDAPLIPVTPISEHVGIIKEGRQWFPIEFTKNNEETLVLTVHDIIHTEMP